MVLMAAGERDSATEELERLVEIDPSHTAAQLDLAIVSLSRGDLEEALVRLDAVFERDALNQRALFYRAVVLDMVGRSEEAAPLLERLAGSGEGKYAARARTYLRERAGGE
jgi:Tfp pilus assembly protein PilF